MWRTTILEGEPADPEWPRHLPALTPDLRLRFSWRRAPSPYTTESWRSATWSAERFAELAEHAGFRPSLVPVYEVFLVDVTDGTIGIASEGADLPERRGASESF